MADADLVQCPHCDAWFQSADGVTADDRLADHVTDHHQDKLRQVFEGRSVA